MAAIDQAVADGVDVINFSISGTADDFLDPVEIAFLFAADAGIFVAASAGNEGPGPSTINHPSPWLTTVAAGTHDRLFQARLTLGNGISYTGASLQDSGSQRLDMVYAGSIPASGATVEDAALCMAGSINRREARGKMVICDRGVNARTEKSQTVADAGGKAMVLVNVVPGTLDADIHVVPSIHLNEIDGAAVKLYVESESRPRGRISPSSIASDPSAPQVADFSSRGPALAGGDVLKPDIMAPGVNILAAYSPLNGGESFAFLQGTSMASPHIAGLGAVVMSAHPDWTPAMIKSALMTTATDTASAGAFDEGSGQVTPNSALNPGLVYNAGFDEYLGFLCGTGQFVDPVCDTIGIDPSDLNQPNIAIGDLAGSQVVTRTVTNVGVAATFNVSVQSPPGVNVSVSPTSLTLAQGESASYQVSIDRAGATLGQYTFGSLTWAGAGAGVRTVIAVRPVQLAAPTEVFGTGTDGQVTYTVGFGYDGPFTVTGHGLVAPLLTDGTVVDDPANDINTALETGVGITIHEVAVPAGTAVARFALFDEFTDGEDDLDLYVFDAAGNFIGQSGTGTSAEQVDVELPTAASYLVIVHGWETDGPDTNYSLFSWNVPLAAVDPTQPGALTVTGPATAVLGGLGDVTASWAGLVPGPYLGAVSYSDGVGMIGLTKVTVEAG